MKILRTASLPLFSNAMIRLSEETKYLNVKSNNMKTSSFLNFLKEDISLTFVFENSLVSIL